MSEPVFLFDEDVVALGKVLRTLYPDTVYISGWGEALPKRAPDGALYWDNAYIPYRSGSELRQRVISLLLPPDARTTSASAPRAYQPEIM